MSSIDLTVAITAHGESLEAGPTLRSVTAAMNELRTYGAKIEPLVGLDCASDLTTNFFSQSALTEWEQLAFSFGDQGLARNALAQRAKGRYIAFIDADDLVSENWLALAYATLERDGGAESKNIMHPELIWQFDRSNTVYTQPAQDSPLFTPHHMAIQNYYDAMCMAPTRAYLDVPFPHRDVKAGYAYEDWQWNIATIDAGWFHQSVSDTLVFKRRRDVSQSQKARTRGVTIRQMPSFRIDRIKSFGKDIAIKANKV